jgi:hypothetical protein
LREQSLQSAASEAGPSDGGVTPRVVALCLALALFFGYVIPIIDVKLANTFLGAQSLPPGAVGALLVLLLVVNPLLQVLGRACGARPSVAVLAQRTAGHLHLVPVLVFGAGARVRAVSGLESRRAVLLRDARERLGRGPRAVSARRG